MASFGRSHNTGAINVKWMGLFLRKSHLFFSFSFFFLSWFSFTNIHESQDCRGGERAFH